MNNIATGPEHADTHAASIKKFSSNTVRENGEHVQRVIVNLFTKGGQLTYDRFDDFESALSFVENVTGREWFVTAAKSQDIKPGGRRFLEGGIMTYFTMTDDI